MTIKDLILNTSFTITIWIRTGSSGQLFTIDNDSSTEASGENILNLGINAVGKPTLRLSSATQVAHEATGTHDVNDKDWKVIGYSLTRTQGNTKSQITVNTEISSQSTEFIDAFIDLASNSHFLAAERNFVEAGVLGFSNHYTGMIWEVCIYTAGEILPPMGPEDCETGYCSACPDDICVIDCDWNQFLIPTGACLQCDEECTTGCVRLLNCNPCDDEQCLKCSNYSDCEQCIPNASGAPNEDCVCDSKFYYEPTSNSCLACDSICAECFGQSQQECTECEEGAFLLDTFCLDPCPSGYTENEETNACDFNEDTFCFIFDGSLQYDWTVKTLVAIGGDTQDVREFDEPIPIFRRGVWFDGVDDYFLISDLQMSLNFSIEIWIRPQSNRGAVWGGTFVFDFPSWLLTFTYNNEEIQEQEPSVVQQQWQNLKLTCEFIAPGSRIRMYKDGIQGGTAVYPDAILDSSSLPHYVGKSRQDFFTGFIYSICFYQYVKTDFDLDPNPGCLANLESTVAPIGPVCLIECN